jgi:hypothetical protein
MKFPILVIDSLEFPMNATSLPSHDQIIDLSKKLLFLTRREFLDLFNNQNQGQKNIILLHGDLIPSSKNDLLNFVKNEIYRKKGTILDNTCHSSSSLTVKIAPEVVEKKSQKSTINFQISQNAQEARQALQLPHTKMIGNIFYTHDAQDALDSEDEDLDF